MRFVRGVIYGIKLFLLALAADHHSIRPKECTWCLGDCAIDDYLLGPVTCSRCNGKGTEPQ